MRNCLDGGQGSKGIRTKECIVREQWKGGCHVNSILLDTGCSHKMTSSWKKNGCQSDVCMVTLFFTL